MTFSTRTIRTTNAFFDQNNSNRADIELSPQPLLDCGKAAGSCEGGEEKNAFEWIAVNGITDTSCSPYLAVDGNCLNGANMCRFCFHVFLRRHGTADHSFLSGHATMTVRVYRSTGRVITWRSTPGLQQPMGAM